MVEIQQNAIELILTTSHILCVKTRNKQRTINCKKNCVEKRFRLLFHRGVHSYMVYKIMLIRTRLRRTVVMMSTLTGANGCHVLSLPTLGASAKGNWDGLHGDSVHEKA